MLEGAQASVDELMHETAVALVELFLVQSAQELRLRSVRDRLRAENRRDSRALRPRPLLRPKLGVRYLPVNLRLLSIDFSSSSTVGLSARRYSGKSPARWSLGRSWGNSGSHPW